MALFDGVEPRPLAPHDNVGEQNDAERAEFANVLIDCGLKAAGGGGRGDERRARTRGTSHCAVVSFFDLESCCKMSSALLSITT